MTLPGREFVHENKSTTAVDIFLGRNNNYYYDRLTEAAAATHTHTVCVCIDPKGSRHFLSSVPIGRQCTHVYRCAIATLPTYRKLFSLFFSFLLSFHGSSSFLPFSFFQVKAACLLGTQSDMFQFSSINGGNKKRKGGGRKERDKAFLWWFTRDQWIRLLR